jgi:signal transduction histidine kinase
MRDHELRNELTVILGFSELLIARAPAGDSTRADLEAIRDAAVSALRQLEGEHRPPAALRAPLDTEQPAGPRAGPAGRRSERQNSGR